MTAYAVRLPDVGEGVAEAELVQWLVSVGERVTPDSALAEVLTDKATVEIACPVTGTIAALFAEPGDTLAVGSDLVTVHLDADDARGTTEVLAAPDDAARADPKVSPPVVPVDTAAPLPSERGRADVDGDQALRPRAAPAVRRAAYDRGIALDSVRGSGPGGRIMLEDLDAAGLSPMTDDETSIPVRGMRRRIAERLTTTWNAPHITYVEEVDVTEVERLREVLNHARPAADRLTPVAFIARAVVLACGDHPEMNAHVNGDATVITRHRSVHLGIATQTDSGLVVPVVRGAEQCSIADLGREIRRVAEATRSGSADRALLAGSTITISSLGSLGGLMTTPLLNHPEVAIVGVNRIATRPSWDDRTFVPRQMMNISASFDHRVVDGWDAAVFVQRIRALLETPALLTIDGAGR